MNLNKLNNMTQREICAYIIKLEMAIDEACEHNERKKEKILKEVELMMRTAKEYD